MSDSRTTCRRVRAAIRAAALLALAGWIVIAQTAHAVEPVFHPSLETATEAAASDQSLVLLIFSAEWCGPCKLLKSQTLASPRFKEQDVPLHVVDIDVDANPKLAHDFAAQAIPTLVLLTPDGRIVLRETGYMDADNLKQWLQEGRRRAAAGQWEGAAADDKLDDLKQKASIDELATNDIRQLIEFLADSNPANRSQAGKILLSQRESIVPGLIDAVGDPYLGQRIGAAELLLRLAPKVPSIDPWKSQSEMSNTVVALKQWWSTTRRLPMALDDAAPVSRDSVREMIDQLRGNDPVRRTAAMTALIDQGRQILPQIRDSIRKSEKSGDQRSVSLLEDVRWGILVSDDLEQRTHVRAVLAHGKSPERQAAADRLGAAGKGAVEPLKELATDPDTLVVESAIRNLAELGGGTAVTALSTLLQSSDDNLRMEAAQALGRTKDSNAVKPLLPAFKDTNEIVVCAAISALEDLHTSGRYDRTSPCSPEETAALKASLTDSRWRVRAAAAEVIGTLELKDLSNDVLKLLNDTDGFVVNKALLSLKKLGMTPEASELAAISKRLPGLQGDTTKMMLQSHSGDAPKIITEIFDKGSNDTRIVILKELAAIEEDESGGQEDNWKPILSRAVESRDPQLRLGAARVLEQHPSKLAATFLETLLSDGNRETRQTAVRTVLKVLDRDTGGFRPNSYSSDSTKPKPMASAQQTAAWHKAMLKHLEIPPDFLTAAAVYVTGDARENLQMLEATLAQPVDDTKAQQQINLVAVSVILHSLPWPEGKPVADKLSSSLFRYACAVAWHNRAGKEIAGYLMDPARFKAVMEPATGASLETTLEMVAGYDYDYDNRNKQWSLWKETPETQAIALALANSTNAAWRAAAVFSLGAPSFATQHAGLFRSALSDPNPWVRASAIKSLAHAVDDQALIEQYVSPLLADTNSHVASVAAVALLQPEIRKAADLYNLDGFKYEEIDGGHSSVSSRDNDRPLTTLDSKPPFLDVARKWLSATNIENIVPFALLLAQYGDSQGTDRLAADPQVTDLNRSSSEAALVAIGLSHDAKYVPLLRKMTESEHHEWNFRKVLQALRSMTGPEARQLRLDINKKIRERNNSGD